MGNSFWILFAALNNLKPWHLTIAEVKVFSYSLCVTFCPLHYGVINGHRALDVTEKCLKVVWSHVLFTPWKCNARYVILYFVLGDFQNRTWAPNWNWAFKPATEKQPSGLKLKLDCDFWALLKMSGVYNMVARAAGLTPMWKGQTEHRRGLTLKEIKFVV